MSKCRDRGSSDNEHWIKNLDISREGKGILIASTLRWLHFYKCCILKLWKREEVITLTAESPRAIPMWLLDVISNEIKFVYKEFNNEQITVRLEILKI